MTKEHVIGNTGGDGKDERELDRNGECSGLCCAVGYCWWPMLHGKVSRIRMKEVLQAAIGPQIILWDSNTISRRTIK